MKKILLASTALVLSAGIAAAEVKVTGDARMGLISDNGLGVAANSARVQFTSRARVTFTLSGQTDTGLAFGASFRADNAGAAAGNTAMTAGTVFVSGAFGRLAMGDVAGAARAAVGDLYGVGLTGLADLNEMAYLDRRPTINGIAGGALSSFERRTAALYEYKIEGLTLYVGIAQPSRAAGATAPVAASAARTATGAPAALAAGQSYTESQYSLGVKYTFDAFTGALGYETFNAKFNNGAGVTTRLSANHLIGSLEYNAGDIKAKFIAGRIGGNLGTAMKAAPGVRTSQYGLSVEGKFDATTVTAFVKRGFVTTDYGIGASYDLGGGARVVGGISRQGSNTTAGVLSGRTRADLGLSFTF